MYRRILKTLGWLALAVMVVLATIILIQVGRGYSYDFHTGRLKLNGLVILSSVPSGADISVNGKLVHHRTPYRSTYEAGEYSFGITKDGYRPWSKRIAVAGSEVSWAQYILLLPNQLTSNLWFSTKSSLSLLATSRDHRHFAYLDGADGAVWGFDTSSHKPAKLYTPEASATGQPVETITALAFSGDANSLLVTASSGANVYERLVNLSNRSVVKLTEQYGFGFNNLRFNPTNSSQLFWLSADGLRRIDTASQSVSAVLADKVSAYAFNGGGQIIYIQTTDLGQAVYSMDTSGQNKHQLIQSVVASPSYQIAFASYRSSDVLAILPAGSRTITLYSKINSDNPVATVISKSADDMMFNPDGRFINYRDSQRLGTFDLELNRTYNFGPSPSPYQLVTWFDTYHLLVANASGISLQEFDGGNPALMSDNFLAGLVSFTSNGHEVLVAQAGTSPAGTGLKAIIVKP